MGLLIRTTNTTNTTKTTPTYSLPKKAFKLIDGEWVPIKKVYINGMYLEIRESELKEQQLSITKKAIDNQILELQMKATNAPLSGEELIKLDTLIKTKPIIELEQVELSKQLNLVKTELLYSRTLVIGADLITTLNNITKSNEIGYSVIEVNQIGPTDISLDLVFKKETDFKFNGRYYRIIDTQTTVIDSAITELVTKFGNLGCTYFPRTVKETISSITAQLMTAASEANRLMDNINIQQNFIENNINAVTTTINTFSELLTQNILAKEGADNTKDLVVNTKVFVGDTLAKSLNITKEELKTVTDNSPKILQINSNISAQSNIINKVTLNINDLKTATLSNESTETLAAIAENLFLEPVQKIDEETNEITYEYVNLSTQLIELSLSKAIIPSGTIKTTFVPIFGKAFETLLTGYLGKIPIPDAILDFQLVKNVNVQPSGDPTSEKSASDALYMLYGMNLI
jgi:hypothetical protein